MLYTGNKELYEQSNKFSFKYLVTLDFDIFMLEIPLLLVTQATKSHSKAMPTTNKLHSILVSLISGFLHQKANVGNTAMEYNLIVEDTNIQ